MSRPSKPISPDTLGGRLRATREKLGLSLEQVAGATYSTSLISQIERNRVDPSERSLEFLAKKLQLPLAELKELTQRQRKFEAEAQHYRLYEEQRLQASQALTNNHIRRALELLETIPVVQLPISLRWRVVALRGECYFKQRRFLMALQNFLYAVAEIPELPPTNPEQHLEVLILHLHLGATHRELEQLDEAFRHYHIALAMVNANTPFGYLAEAHWGLALVAYNRASRLLTTPDDASTHERYIQEALQHAEHARALYRSVGEQLRAALLTCELALIELARGNREGARTLLREVFNAWKPILDQQVNCPSVSRREAKEQANVVSAAACYLAEIEFLDSHYEKAREYADQALEAGKLSYILRRAEAYMMLGRILEALNPHDTAAEQAFRDALTELAPTDRVAAKIRAHDFLGRHLLKKGGIAAGEVELDLARKLSSASATFSSATTSAED